MARGSIIKRGSSWRIAVDLPSEDGKRRQKWETVRGTKKDAEKRLTQLLAEVDQQKLVASPKMPLGDFLQQWLRDYASAKAPKTAYGYGLLIRCHVVPHLGTVRLDKLTPAHLVHWLATLREKPVQRGEGTLSASTIHDTYRVLKTALNTAVRWGLLGHNPIDRIDAPSVPRKEMKTFDVQQAQAFLEAAAVEGTKWQAFFTLALTTGLRLGELKGLRWQDLDLDSGTVRVQQAIARVNKVGVVRRQPKTAGSRRPVAIGQDVVSLLRQHRIEQNQERLSMGPLWKDNDLVFASQVGTPVESKKLHEAFTRICKRAGVPRIRPYDLRHTSASLLLAAGVHPKIVAERLGHANVNLTLSTYSHVLPGLQQDAAETLERMLRNAPARRT